MEKKYIIVEAVSKHRAFSEQFSDFRHSAMAKVFDSYAEALTMAGSEIIKRACNSQYIEIREIFKIR